MNAALNFSIWDLKQLKKIWFLSNFTSLHKLSKEEIMNLSMYVAQCGDHQFDYAMSELRFLYSWKKKKVNIPSGLWKTRCGLPESNNVFVKNVFSSDSMSYFYNCDICFGLFIYSHVYVTRSAGYLRCLNDFQVERCLDYRVKPG